MSKKPRKGASRQQQQAEVQAKRALASRAQARPSSSSPAVPAPTSSAAARPAAGAGELRVIEATRPGPAQAVYLDVAAVRIQEWLGRTPALKFRRGASVLLSEATAESAWEDHHLPAGVTWNTEAGEVSGVVSLRLPPGEGNQPAAEVARDTAALVVRQLRQRLPHCGLQAVAARAASYTDAYHDLSQARRSDGMLIDSPAPPCETVLAKPCDMCRSAPAVHAQEQVVDRSLDLCAECLLRRDAGGLTKGTWQERSPLTERRLLAALKERHPSVAGFSDDFYELASAGEHADGDAATQLALVFADGNKVGDFLARVSSWVDKHGSPAKHKIVEAIDDATQAALADAVTETFLLAPHTAPAPDGTERLGRRNDQTRPPVLVHLAGGDDLLVSVPAGDGWRFTRALLAAFDRALAKTSRAWGLRDIPVPSLSAGVVFHHQSHPFADALAKAEARLKVAKLDTKGETAAVAFVDLTADGDQPTPGRPTRSLTDLDSAAALLTRLAGVPQSQRTALVALCRQADLSTPEDAEDAGASGAETAAAALARRAVDLGSTPVWQVVAGPGATAEQVRQRLTDLPCARQDLRHHLDLARWWPR